MKHIAIIDDSKLKRDYLRRILAEEFRVYEYESGAAALPELPFLDIQCILLDVEMPEEDGFAVIKRIKASPSLRDIPVIFVTSLSDWELETRGLSSGAVDFLGNQFSPEIIRSRVRNHVDLFDYKQKLEQRVREKTQTIFELQDAIMVALSDLVECRDENTAGHAQRTRGYVECLIRALQKRGDYADELTEDFVRDLIRAAPLHDIGKIGIRDAVLNKPGRLSPEEFEEMKKHTVFGATAILRAMKILHQASFLCILRDISLSHHEKWDGSGYPLGLDGIRIPLCGRIMAIADVYDALVSKRPYKEPMPHEKAAGIILEGKGRHFDPLVTDAFDACQEEFRAIAMQH